jgi:hypothetical protein
MIAIEKELKHITLMYLLVHSVLWGSHPKRSQRKFPSHRYMKQ